MTEKERSFKIESIKKYNKDLETENHRANTYEYLLMGSVIASALLFSTDVTDAELIKFIIVNGFAGGFVATSVISLKELIKSIGKQTVLNNNIELLNNELNADKNERSLR